MESSHARLWYRQGQIFTTPYATGIRCCGTTGVYGTRTVSATGGEGIGYLESRALAYELVTGYLPFDQPNNPITLAGQRSKKGHLPIQRSWYRKVSEKNEVIIERSLRDPVGTDPAAQKKKN